LIEGRVDPAWARWVRPWTLAAWIFLTIGIALGSWWAYYELGWGGWWFWDPVENASFMPWLVGTALLHSAIVVEKRDALKGWTILLAIVTFGLSLLGTFLVRSGVLTSVHAFAVDPDRGVFILALMIIIIGGSFALFAWRGPQLAGRRPVPADLAGRGTAAQQPASDHGGGDGPARHALPADAGGGRRRQGHRGAAVLQRGFHSLDGAADRGAGGGAAAAVEARRPRRGAEAAVAGRRGGDRGGGGGVDARQQYHHRHGRDRAGGLAVRRRAHRTRRAHPAYSIRRRPKVSGVWRDCRGPPSA
jgi:hypothetical protein